MMKNKDSQKIPLESADKLQICDGFGCTNSSVNKIKISVGKFGVISVYLCTICSKKF
jgi:hypothetical protein